jgi:ADP-ribose pyrophosphatase YjhB (NUDIX family)
MKKAAGVLVTNEDGKILGFLRRGRRNPGYGLPCGSLEYGETWDRAAKRETFEETGLRVTLLPDPYLDRDTKGRVRTIIFRAEISGGRMDAPSIREGYPEWITPKQLLEGPYGEFSVPLLQHFGLLPAPVGSLSPDEDLDVATVSSQEG